MVTIPSHAVISDLLARVRDESVDPPEFRRLVRELAEHLTYEAVRSWSMSPVRVPTPLGIDADGARWAGPTPILVPILRAGLGMLEGSLHVLPVADVGVVGLRKDPTTFIPDLYCAALPQNLTEHHAIVLDPMLATGNTMAAACEILTERGCPRVTAVCIIAAPEGLANLADRFPLVEVVAAVVDPEIDHRAFILPGLGDAGDRLYGPP